MAFSPLVQATLQSSLIAGLSNILAQFISAYQSNTPFIINWIPVFQFFIFSCVSSPPYMLWLEYLEQTFPGYHMAPTEEALKSAAKGDDKELDREAKDGRLVEPKLSIRNTLLKTALDQSLGATWNTFLFCVFMGGMQQAMPAISTSLPDSLTLLASGKAFDAGSVDWAAVMAKTRAEYWAIMRAGWQFWPFVSLGSFAFVKTTEMRTLVGSLAGVAWGVYMSMMAAQ